MGGYNDSLTLPLPLSFGLFNRLEELLCGDENYLTQGFYLSL